MNTNLEQMQLNCTIENINSSKLYHQQLIEKGQVFASRIDLLASIIRTEIQKEEEMLKKLKKAVDMFSTAVCS